MSSRILRKASAAEAAPLVWTSIGGSIDDTASNESDAAPESIAPPDPGGPTWEEYRALEAKLRSLEQQAPAREQAIRQAARQEADAAAEARWKEALERTARSLVELAAFRPKLRKDAEEDVVKLSVAMARRILRRELTLDAEAMVGLVKAAMERIELRETHRVRLRPEDAPLIKAFLDRIGGPHRIDVVPDNTIERGGLLFETQRGTMDASVETQLDEIERGFTDLLGRKNER